MTQPIPPQQWSKDHFSVLLYAEDCATNQSGEMKSQHLRGYCRTAFTDMTQNWPGTRLKDGTEQAEHNDGDCLDDLEDAGLLYHTGEPNWLVQLSDAGRQLVTHLRHQKSQKIPYSLPDNWQPQPHMLTGELPFAAPN